MTTAAAKQQTTENEKKMLRELGRKANIQVGSFSDAGALVLESAIKTGIGIGTLALAKKGYGAAKRKFGKKK